MTPATPLPWKIRQLGEIDFVFGDGPEAFGTIEGWNEAAKRGPDVCHIEWWKAMLEAAPLPPVPAEEER